MNQAKAEESEGYSSWKKDERYPPSNNQAMDDHEYLEEGSANT